MRSVLAYTFFGLLLLWLGARFPDPVRGAFRWAGERVVATFSWFRDRVIATLGS